MTTINWRGVRFSLVRSHKEQDRCVTRLTSCGPPRDHGKLGGRPRALKDDDIAAARAMLKDPDILVSEVARRLKVSPANFYRHFPGDRGGIQDGLTHG